MIYADLLADILVILAAQYDKSSEVAVGSISPPADQIWGISLLLSPT